MIDRSEASRALAKAIAFKQSGKDDKAHEAATELINMLRDAGILYFT